MVHWHLTLLLALFLGGGQRPEILRGSRLLLLKWPPPLTSMRMWSCPCLVLPQRGAGRFASTPHVSFCPQMHFLQVPLSLDRKMPRRHQVNCCLGLGRVLVRASD